MTIEVNVYQDSIHLLMKCCIDEGARISTRKVYIQVFSALLITFSVCTAELAFDYPAKQRFYPSHAKVTKRSNIERHAYQDIQSGSGGITVTNL
jgi:hypothetical protein